MPSPTRFRSELFTCGKCLCILKFFFSFNWSEANSYQVPFLDSALLFFYIIYNFMCSSDLTMHWQENGTWRKLVSGQ